MNVRTLFTLVALFGTTAFAQTPTVPANNNDDCTVITPKVRPCTPEERAKAAREAKDEAADRAREEARESREVAEQDREQEREQARAEAEQEREQARAEAEQEREQAR